MSEQARAEWRQIVPLLQVGNLAESLEYYTAVLGFEVAEPGDERDSRGPTWCAARRALC